MRSSLVFGSVPIAQQNLSRASATAATEAQLVTPWSPAWCVASGISPWSEDNYERYGVYGTVGRMSTERLTPTSYLVLGLLTREGPSTPYDLERHVAATLGNFWS